MADPLWYYSHERAGRIFPSPCHYNVACPEFPIHNSPNSINYSSGLLRFTKFCNDYKILEWFRMPASEALLTVLITCHATGSVSSSTLRHWLLGLELWHEINGSPLARPFNPETGSQSGCSSPPIYHILTFYLGGDSSCPSHFLQAT